MYKTNVSLNREHVKQLTALGKSRGLCASALIRMAIADYIQRETRAAKEAQETQRQR